MLNVLQKFSEKFSGFACCLYMCATEHRGKMPRLFAFCLAVLNILNQPVKQLCCPSLTSHLPLSVVDTRISAGLTGH